MASITRQFELKPAPTATFIGVPDDSQFMTITNLGPGTAYYSQTTPLVSASLNTGSVASGATATLTPGQYFVAAAGTVAVVTATPTPPTITKRVTLCIGSDGVSVNTAASLDYNQRTLVQLPVTTKRWRLRVRNCSALTGTANASAMDCSGVWIGTPNYAAGGVPWGRAFVSAPTQALPSFSTPADGSEYTSGWVTDPALQFQRGVPTGVSHGLSATPSTTFAYSSMGWTYGGVGKAAGAGLAATPTGLNNFVVLDTRIEYEFETPTGISGIPTGVCIGDSITSGWSSDTSTPASALVSGCDPHQTWPGASGIAGGFAWVNMGVGSTKAQDWSNYSGWRWLRCDITTTVPDFAIVSLGTNDVFAGTAVATIQQYIQAVITNLRILGINEIYLGTIVPRNYAGANETDRIAMNNWMRNMPGGIAGVFDFDKVTYLQATPAVMDSDYVGSLGYPHPSRAGYQQMANAVRRTKQ